MNNVDRETIKALVREVLEEIQNEKDQAKAHLAQIGKDMSAEAAKRYASTPKHEIEEAIKRFWRGDGWRGV